MKKLAISLLLFVSIQLSGFGQTMVYDLNFKAYPDCKTINEYAKKKGVETISELYNIGSESVVELYQKKDGKLIGIVVDTTKVDIKKLRHHKQDKRMSFLMSKYDVSTAIDIFNGRAIIGMSTEEATDSWGKPQDVNKTTTGSGSKEQWVYGNGNYLYFEDGVLTTIQN